MNETLAVLRRKRMADAEPREAAETAPVEGEMSEYWKKIDEMNMKLDKVLEILGGEAPEEQPQEVAGGVEG